MDQITSWEKNSTVRNRPRRILNRLDSGDFFPELEQPLCLHPRIAALGVDAKKNILIQSAYMFMKTIAVNETEVICDIANRILTEESQIRFPEKIRQSLRTVIIDETYHAYVAHDFIFQLEAATGISPITWKCESSLSRAIKSTKSHLSHPERFVFEIIAACIAENSITKELLQITHDPQLNPFFNEVNSDHSADEGRHCGIFLDVLSFLWNEVPAQTKDLAGPILPFFLREYFRKDVKIESDRAILRALELESEEIELILRDTHPKFPSENLQKDHPVSRHIMTLLRKAGVMDHAKTRSAFEENGNPAISVPLSELRLSPPQWGALLLSYLHDVTQKDSIRVQIRSRTGEGTVTIPVVSNVEKAGETIGSFCERISQQLKDGIQTNNFDLYIEETLLLSFSNPAFDFSKATLTCPDHFFDGQPIEELAENFSYYAKSALESITTSREKIPLVCPKQRELLFSQYLLSAEPYDVSVVSLFQNQLRQSPTQIAIVDDSTTLTYEQLDRLSEQVKWSLLEMGLSRGALVAIVHEHRGSSYIPIILGILKAGMAFLPLSRELPSLRIQTVLEDVRPSLVITHLGRMAEDLGQGFETISESLLLNKEIRKTDLTANSDSLENLAYIIHTSGSTGVPKGVMVTHRSLSYFVQSAARTFPIENRDRLLQFSDFSFDASLADIFGALVSGATLCIRTPRMVDSSAQFFSECERLEVTLLNLSASFWSQLVEDLLANSLTWPSSVKTVIVGGEAISLNVLEAWYGGPGKNVRLVNTYGPTETTIAVTACDLGKYPLLRTQENLIGSAFAGASLYVLDAHQRLLPIGAAGELYVGGPGVSKGYYKREDLTSERFLPRLDFKELLEGPLYRTGDRVRWIPTGSEKILSFLGRNDRQIKIRGFRVELSEIERNIELSSDISNCVVVFDKPSASLIAFIMPRKLPFDGAKLREKLSLKLPPYMQPSQFNVIDKWPMTKNGKTDTAYLLREITSVSSKLEFGDLVENRLAEIWKELLPNEKINPESHFFNSGGHSLLAMRLVAKIQSEFGVSVTLRQILENPMLLELANLIRDLKKTPTVGNGCKLGPLTHFQEGLWLIDRLSMGKAPQYNIAYALDLIGPLNYGALKKALEHLIERHPLLSSVIREQEGATIQEVVKREYSFKIERVTKAEFESLALNEARTPFDLERAPPFRARLFSLESEHHVFLIHHHHIVHDGESIGVFLKELGECYESFVTQTSPNLPLLGENYFDFATRQRQEERRLQKSLDYWKEQLTGYHPLRLPFRKRAKHDSLNGGSVQFTFTPESVDSLRKFCHSRDCTLFVGLLSSLVLLLHRHFNIDDVAFGAILSTRDYQKHAHTFGPFLNAVILRHRLEVSETIESILTKVKQTYLQAMEHREAPLTQITHLVPLERLPEDHSLFDIMVGFHRFEKNLNRFESKSIKSDLRFIDNKTSKFGLSLDFYEKGVSLELRIEFSRTLYEEADIVDFGHQFISIVSQAHTNVVTKGFATMDDKSHSLRKLTDGPE